MTELLHIPARRNVRILPDFSHTPVRISLPRNRRPATIVLALVSIWGAAGIVGLFQLLAWQYTIAALSLSAILTIAFVVTLVSIWIGFLAMRSYVTNDEILLFKDHVDLSTYTLFGKRNRSAELSEFRGLHTREIKKTGKDSNKPYQLIELVHPSPEKSLPLYLVRRTHPPQTVLEELAQRYALPLL